MAIIIKNTNESLQKKEGEALPARYIKSIIYGPPGSGKTFFAGSANDHPETANILVGDFDEGTLTLEGSNIDFTPLKGWQDAQSLYEFLRDYCVYRDVYFSDSSTPEEKSAAKGRAAVLHGVTDQEGYDNFVMPKYLTVALDTVTEGQKINMKHIMAEVVKARPDQDPDVPSVREWGISGNQIRTMLKAFRSLPMHVFFFFHVAESKDEKLGTVELLPSIPGKLAREVPSYVDIVGYMQSWTDKETEQFRNNLYVVPFGQHSALKDRTKALGAGVSMPTIGKIFDLIDNRRQALVAAQSKLDAKPAVAASKEKEVIIVKNSPAETTDVDPTL